MQGIQGFNWVDNVFFAILLVSAITGLFRGGVREIVALLSWFAGFLLGAAFSHPLAKLFAGSQLFSQITNTATESLGSDASAQVSMFSVGVCFIVLFCVTVFIGTLLGRAMHSMVESNGISFLNRFMGVLFGTARGVLGSLVLIFIVNLSPLASESAWVESRMVVAYKPAEQFFSMLVQPSVNQLRKRVDSINTPVPIYRND